MRALGLAVLAAPVGFGPVLVWVLFVVGCLVDVFFYLSIATAGIHVYGVRNESAPKGCGKVEEGGVQGVG